MSLHLALAVVAGVLAALVGGLAIVGRLRGAMPRFAIDRTVLAAEAVIGLAAASGLVQLATGSGPHDGLHLIYAAVALLALPVGRAWRGLVRGPRTVPLVIAAAVLLGVLVRLAQTG